MEELFIPTKRQLRRAFPPLTIVFACGKLLRFPHRGCTTRKWKTAQRLQKQNAAWRKRHVCKYVWLENNIPHATFVPFVNAGERRV
jgi:hypothetical protein